MVKRDRYSSLLNRRGAALEKVPLFLVSRLDYFYSFLEGYNISYFNSVPCLHLQRSDLPKNTVSVAGGIMDDIL